MLAPTKSQSMISTTISATSSVALFSTSTTFSGAHATALPTREIFHPRNINSRGRMPLCS